MKTSLTERFLKGQSELVPPRLRQKAFALFEFAGISGDYRVFLGKKVFAVILAGFFGFIASLLFFPFFLGAFSLIYFFAAIFAGFFFAALLAIVFFLKIDYASEKRAAETEKYLPDFLNLVSININAGMTPFTAFSASARKEFGTLYKEIQAVFSKSFESQSFSEISVVLVKKINSRALEETLTVFVEAQHSGGKMVRLLEKLSENFRKKHELKKEIVSSTQMYVLFVFFVILVATPLLLAVSSQFLKMVTEISEQNQYSGQSIAGLGFFSAQLSISVEFMQSIAFLLLLINSVFSSLFVGLLQSGKATSGLRLFPLLFVCSIAVYFAGSFVVEGFLGSWF